MPGILFPRRRLLMGAGVSLLVPSWWRPLRADEVVLPVNTVRFRPEIEPLVRLLEETPREKIFGVVAQRIRAGLTYPELLAATLLAGIRNVQPRPDVGFKFHCVMVMHAAHQATLAARDEHRWFPLFWSLDYFKRCQAQDRDEGDWTMSATNAANSADWSRERTARELEQGLERWDVEKADVAATVAAAKLSSSQLLDLFSRFGARDFRNIGHKAIWVAGAFRTLEVIGWEHAEPVLRSLAYATLNHSREPNPADHELAPDRAGRANWERVRQSSDPSTKPDLSDAMVSDWIREARTSGPDALAESTQTMLQQGASEHRIYDGILCAAAELVMRQPAIVPLHAVTTSNALHYLVRSVHDEPLRRWLILQNASFLAHFRESAQGRGDLRDADLLQLQPSQRPVAEASELFETLGSNRDQAASDLLQYFQQGGDDQAVLRAARELIFLKGTDSHDYKYSSALFEDYRNCSPTWRGKFLAAGCHLLTSRTEPDNGLRERIEDAFA